MPQDRNAARRTNAARARVLAAVALGVLIAGDTTSAKSRLKFDVEPGSGIPEIMPKDGEQQPSQDPVVVDLFVMSLCPWGVKAEDVLIPAVRPLAPDVSLKLHFIATTQPSADGDPAKAQFTAMHGEPEVQENIRQLCALRQDSAKGYNYILARNRQISSPDWQAAAKEAGLDVAAMEQCAGGAEGKALHFENVKTHLERQARSSPTIDIDGTRYQGARGKKSLTLALCQALKAKGRAEPVVCGEAAQWPDDPAPTASGCGGAAKPMVAGGGGGCGAAGAAGGCGGGAGGCGGAAGGCGGAGGCAGCAGCGGAQAPTATAVGVAGPPSFDRVAPWQGDLEIQVVTEESCRVCALRLMPALKRLLPKATLTRLDAKSKAGAAHIGRFGAKALPLYVLDRRIEQASNFAQFKPLLVSKDSWHAIRPDLSMPVIRMERDRVPNHLDVFVNSLAGVTPLVEAELMRFFASTDSSALTFSIHYVVQEAATEPAAAARKRPEAAVRSASVKELKTVAAGPLRSTGGEAELDESLRQICLFQYGSMGDFFTYLNCRSRDLKDASLGSQCLAPGEALARCVKSEGEQLLREDARLARSLGISAGPVILWENRYGPIGFYELPSLDALIGE